MYVCRGEGMGLPVVLALLIYVFGLDLEASYSATASSAKTSRWLTHWFSESGYPFHLIRYWSLCPFPNFWWSRIFSTLYSSPPSSISGRRCDKFLPSLRLSC